MMEILPDDLFSEILSLLSVKTIVGFKCVSKSWNAIISDPTFVKKHLKKSSQNPHLIFRAIWKFPLKRGVIYFPVHTLLNNPSITLSGESCQSLNENCAVVGSCNGLLCLRFSLRYTKYTRYWFCLLNPTTGSISAELGTLQVSDLRSQLGSFGFSFGCDNATGTYKVVAYDIKGDKVNNIPERSCVRVFSLGDNCWRNVNSFPLIPFSSRFNKGVHLSGTINWLALQKYSNIFYQCSSIIYVEQFVIISLDLSTETYTQFLLPPGFEEVPYYQPTLQVLMDCLCFSHDFKKTKFVIWQMKEFGIQESWTQLFRIYYFNLVIHDIPIPYNAPFLLPLYLSKNGDTLILAYAGGDEAIIYNKKGKRKERIRISNIKYWFSAMDYVESLVSTDWKPAIGTQGKYILNWDESEIGEIVGDAEEEE